MKTLLLIILISFVACTNAKPPIAVVTNGDTTFVSPIDDSLYMKLHCKYDSVIKQKDSIKAVLDFQERNLNELIGLRAQDTTKKIPAVPRSFLFPVRPEDYNNIDSVKAYAQNLRIELIRRNLFIVRSRYYLDLVTKHNKYSLYLVNDETKKFLDSSGHNQLNKKSKFLPFYKGWENGMWVNQ